MQKRAFLFPRAGHAGLWAGAGRNFLFTNRTRTSTIKSIKTYTKPRWAGRRELGADLALTETFLAIGVDELSVTPRSVLPLRNAVRMTDTRETSDRILSELDSDYTAR